MIVWDVEGPVKDPGKKPGQPARFNVSISPKPYEGSIPSRVVDEQDYERLREGMRKIARCDVPTPDGAQTTTVHDLQRFAEQTLSDPKGER
jgi:hypothetical protein